MAFANRALGQPPKDMLAWQEKLCHTYGGLAGSSRAANPLNTPQFAFGAGHMAQTPLISSVLNGDSSKNS